MSFQAYIDNIKEKTGMGPSDFEKAADKKGLMKKEIKATVIFNWLKDDYDLGLGHARAIYHLLKPKMK